MTDSMNDGAQWFALFTRHNHEKRVASYCAERQFDHYLPLYQSLRIWSNNRKAIVDFPLFPGYLFVRVAPADILRVLSAPGALFFVGSGNHPTPITDAEIGALRAGLETHRFEPHPYLTEGDRVRIKRGAFAGMQGIFVREKSGDRVVLSIDLIRQSVAVELGSEDIEQLF